MGKKAKAKKAQNETVFQVCKRYLIEGPQGGLEEVLITEIVWDDLTRGVQYFASNERPDWGSDYGFWRRSSDFKIIAELPLKETDNKEKAE